MPPDWLRDLVEELTACLEPVDPRAPLGCHLCHTDEEVWEITLFVSRTEVLGGEYDGEQVPGRFVLDVTALVRVVDDVENCWWQPLPASADDDLGPHLSIVGRHAGHEVWVRITAEQPESIESGRVANVLTGVIERRW
jgi:hypothetical protein